MENANEGPMPGTALFLAGDVRANEQIGLTAMHTLFVREHNRLAAEIATAHPEYDDDAIYERARKIVGAQLQAITFEEFLPALLGPAAPGTYQGYDPGVNPSIANEFSAALFRLGHSMIPEELLRLDAGYLPAAEGSLSLAGAFFNPTLIADSTDLEQFLRGLAASTNEETDTKVVGALRNFLFGPPGSGGLDLVALNIQRGRDHGLPDYNAVREACGLARVASFDEITSNPALADTLATLFGSIDNIDLWVGALAEDHLPGASVGELLAAGIGDQFERLRAGDRFWFENDPAFWATEIEAIRSTTLSDIIRRNTTIGDLPANVMFAVPEPGTWVLAACALPWLPRRVRR
jgi:hypothetical protein